MSCFAVAAARALHLLVNAFLGFDTVTAWACTWAKPPVYKHLNARIRFAYIGSMDEILKVEKVSALDLEKWKAERYDSGVRRSINQY